MNDADTTSTNITSEVTDLATGYIERLLNFMTTQLQQPETYLQLLVLSVVIAVSVVAQQIVVKCFSDELKSDHKLLSTSKSLLLQSMRLIAPAMALIVSLALISAASALQQETDLLQPASRLFGIWLMWSAIHSLVSNPLIRTIGNWVLVPAAFLLVFNELNAVISVMEGFGFSLGEVDITLYTLVKALVFFSILIWIGRFVSDLGNEYIRNKGTLNISTKELLIKLLDIGLYITIFIVTIDLIGIDLTALTVFGGALGVGLGFGLQKIASNFISGLILLTEQSVTIGNLVEMDNGTFGHMRKLGARASVIETLDGQEVMVPNEDFITSRVSNYTHSSNAGRISIPVGVSYDADLKEAQKLILAAAEDYDGISQSPDRKPECFLREFNESSVDFLLVFWMDDVLNGRWRVQSDVMFAVWEKLKEGGIEIPYPQRSLHIKSGSNAVVGAGKASQQDGVSEENEKTETSEAA